MEPLDDRLKKIEDRLAALEKRLGSDSPLVKSSTPAPIQEQPITSREPSGLSLWLKENWLMSIGVFLVILAGGWFVGYAFTNDWIGETGRIVLSSVAGLLVYLWGLKTLKKNPRVGQALIILGEAVLMLSLYAGYQLYALLPAATAFSMMVAIAAFTTVISVINSLEGLGLASVIAAMIIPFLFNEDHPNYTFLMSYVLLIDIAALLMLLRRGWGKVFHAAWLGTLVYSFSLYYADLTNLFIVTFYLLFFLPAALSACGMIDKKLPFKGALILISSLFALIFWVEYYVAFKWSLTFYSAAALLSFCFSYLMAKNWDRIHSKHTTLKYMLGIIFGINVMTFILMANSAINLTYDINIQIIGNSIATLIAVAVALYVLQAPAAAIGVAFYALVPVVMLAGRYPGILYAPINSLDFVTLCVTPLSFGLACLILYKTKISKVSAELSSLHRLVYVCLGILTGIFFMRLIWNLCHNSIETASIARGVALVIYILIAEALIYLGNLKQLKNLRLGGIAIIIFVIWRLLFKEVWEMPIIIRTITFVVTGVLLIGTAWFDKRSSKD